MKINSSSLESNLLLENIYDYDLNIIVPQPFDPSKNDLEIIGDINSPLEFEKNIEEPLVKKEEDEVVTNTQEEKDT